MKEVIKLLADDHESITGKIDEMYSLLNVDPKDSFSKIYEILSFFNDFTFKLHHAREEKVLYTWMLRQNEKSDAVLIQKIMDEHAFFEKSSHEIMNSIDNHLKKLPGETPVSILSDLSLFITKYREHIEREETFIFQIADGLKITASEMQTLLEEMKISKA